MSRKALNFNPSALEATPRPEGESGLEKMAPLLREARVTGRPITEAREQLLQALIGASDKATSLAASKRGIRYFPFSVEHCMVKSLLSGGAYTVFTPAKQDLVSLHSYHREENAALAHFFPRMVPDALFYESTKAKIEPDDDTLHLATSRSPFMVQTTIRDGKTIQEAYEDPETSQQDVFLTNLISLRVSYEKMENEIQLVPDVPEFNHSNILVAPSGQIWIVDTNTLVSPNYYAYYGFNFLSKADRIISRLEARKNMI